MPNYMEIYQTVVIYSNNLNTRLVRYSNGEFVSRCQMVWYLNSGQNTRLKKASMWSTTFGILQSATSCDYLQDTPIQMVTVHNILCTVLCGGHRNIVHKKILMEFQQKHKNNLAGHIKMD